MQTLPLKSVFRGVSALLGEDLTTAEKPHFAAIMASLETWVGIAWEYDFWPELMTVERRAYRDAWAAEPVYAPGTEVFFATDGGYYSANLAPNNPAAGESPATNPEKWTEVTELARYISLDQAGQTPIGGVRRVCRRDPRVYPTRPGEVDFDITDLGIVPDSRVGAQAYVEFRRRPPLFSSDEYAAETAYAKGDGVFYPTTWECYRALATTTGNAPSDASKWEIVPFPALFKRFVERACYVDLLKPEGQTDKSAVETPGAYGLLLQLQDTVFTQQGQHAVVNAKTY